ncbi:MAG: glycosyltransferase family 2 protein [Bellilinea sp.]
MDLSVCIVSFNTRALLRDCLNSLFSSITRYSYEVIITDNGSSDGSQEMLAAEFPRVQVIRNDTNQGYTRPMNQALQAGKGRYLMQLNPDTLLHAGLIDTLVDYMDASPQVGICTPKVLNSDGTLQKQCRRSAARPWDAISYILGLSRLFPGSRFFGRYLMEYLPDDQIAEVEAVSGSCMLIRRAVIEQIGYLDEQFFAYQEDAEFCFRARKAGWKIFFVPQAQVTHYGGQGGSRVVPYRGIYAWHHSFYLYYRKHLAREYFFLINGLVYLGIGTKLFFALLINALRKEKIVGTKKP